MISFVCLLTLDSICEQQQQKLNIERNKMNERTKHKAKKCVYAAATAVVVEIFYVAAVFLAIIIVVFVVDCVT